MEKSESADGFEDAAAEAADSSLDQNVDGAEDEEVVEQNENEGEDELGENATQGQDDSGEKATEGEEESGQNENREEEELGQNDNEGEEAAADAEVDGEEGGDLDADADGDADGDVSEDTIEEVGGDADEGAGGSADGDAGGNADGDSEDEVDLEVNPSEESFDEPAYRVSQRTITSQTSAEQETQMRAVPSTWVDDADSSGASSSEGEEDFGGPLESTDLSWDLKRQIRSLRSGNETATLISLCALKDYDLRSPATLGFLCGEGILSTLCNILETSENRCVIGALQCLVAMTESAAGVRKSMSEQGVLQQLIAHLGSQSIEIKYWASELVGNMSTSGSVRRLFRKMGGMVKLVALLKTNPNARIPGRPDNGEGKTTIQNAATTLVKLTKSNKGREEVRKAGFFSLILNLLALDHVPISVPVFGILSNCLVEKSWGHSLATDTFVEQMVKGLETEFMTMQISCADCINNLVQTEPKMLDSVREKGALGRLLKLLQMNNPATSVTATSRTELLIGNSKRKVAVAQGRGRTPSQDSSHTDKVTKELARRREEVAVAVAGALWRCCASEGNVKEIQKQNGIGVLISSLDSINRVLNKQAENIVNLRMNVAGALAECAKFESARVAIGAGGGIPQLVPLLQSTENALLIRVAEAVGNLAREKSNSRLIIDCNFNEPNSNRRSYLNGSRLLFSLLKKNVPEVQAMAAWASCRLLENCASAEEISRELIGALELIVLLLMQSSDEAVLTEVCNLIGVIALDEENLSVLTDYGVVPALARVTNTPNMVLMAALSFAIGRCCLRWQNRSAFGTNDCVANLVSFLKSNDHNVNRRVTVALYELSRYAPNAITIHQSGGVLLLLPLIGAEEQEMQEAAAGCVSNIRKIALANDIHRTNQPSGRRVSLSKA